MFGKGVYFADMVSKSANYCFTSTGNPTGLLLLCEVALGDMYERLNAEYVTNLPDGKHSTKGVGRTAPDPKESIFTDDGIEIPLGKGIDSGTYKSSLLYNEYGFLLSTFYLIKLIFFLFKGSLFMMFLK